MFGNGLTLTDIAEHYAEALEIPFQKVYDLLQTNPSEEEFERGLYSIMGEKSLTRWRQSMCREHEPVNVGFNQLVWACKRCDADLSDGPIGR